MLGTEPQAGPQQERHAVPPQETPGLDEDSEPGEQLFLLQGDQSYQVAMQALRKPGEGDLPRLEAIQVASLEEVALWFAGYGRG